MRGAVLAAVACLPSNRLGFPATADAQLGAPADFGPPLVTITCTFQVWAEAAELGTLDGVRITRVLLVAAFAIYVIVTKRLRITRSTTVTGANARNFGIALLALLIP